MQRLVQFNPFQVILEFSSKLFSAAGCGELQYHVIIIEALRDVARNVSSYGGLYFAGENILSHRIKPINFRPFITKDKLSFIRLLHPFSLLVLLEKVRSFLYSASAFK